jgi:hypothetical protein
MKMCVSQSGCKSFQVVAVKRVVWYGLKTSAEMGEWGGKRRATPPLEGGLVEESDWERSEWLV